LNQESHENKRFSYNEVLFKVRLYFASQEFIPAQSGKKAA